MRVCVLVTRTVSSACWSKVVRPACSCRVAGLAVRDHEWSRKDIVGLEGETYIYDGHDI